MKKQTIKRQIYSVTAQNDCQVTATIDGTTYNLLDLKAGEQKTFVAISDEVEISDEKAIILPFDNAPATVGKNSGGGANIEIDQIYNATSTNAQSGLAIAEALKTKGINEKPEECDWCLILYTSLIGDYASDLEIENTVKMKNLSSFTFAEGGLMIPLGNYAILVKKPAKLAGMKWDEPAGGSDWWMYFDLARKYHEQNGIEGIVMTEIYFNL